MAKQINLQDAGFTLVELIVVLIMVGILALFVLPRFFNRDTYSARTFGDQMQSMLGYAQKIAIAQNSNVYVCFSAVSVALHFGPDCSGPVVLAPSSNTAATGPTLSGNVNFAVTPSPNAGFYFNALGRPFNMVDTAPTSISTFSGLTVKVNVGGQTVRTITVEQETGYVHQ